MITKLSVQVEQQNNIYQIPIDFERKKRKNLVLKVYKTTGRILLSVPLNTPEEYAKEFLHKQTEWLQKQMQKILPSLNRAEHTYQTGDSFVYLGEKMPFIVITGKKNQVTISDGKIVLQQKLELTKKQKVVLLDKMFNSSLIAILEKSLEKNLTLYRELLPNFDSPIDLKIRKMTNKWAVCRPIKKQISFNKSLIQVPLDLIDYVMVHELCHFRHLNHSKLFWQMVARKMPCWQNYRERLKTVQIDI